MEFLQENYTGNSSLLESQQGIYIYRDCILISTCRAYDGGAGEHVEKTHI